MRVMKPWDSLVESRNGLWRFFLDNLVVVGAFAIIGFSALIVHKSVVRFRLWGVPSNLISGMEVLDVCIWGIDALTVLWLCGALTVRFCRNVFGGQ
jgi:hypothetical protein